jgi:hypothetical protein
MTICDCLGVSETRKLAAPVKRTEAEPTATHYLRVADLLRRIPGDTIDHEGKTFDVPLAA